MGNRLTIPSGVRFSPAENITLLRETFESPDVSATGYLNNSIPDNGKWVGSNTGFGSSSRGLDHYNSANWTPDGRSNNQAYNLRYTNAGLTTAQGVLETIDLNYVRYTLRFRVQHDDYQQVSGSPTSDTGSNAYAMYLMAWNNADDRGNNTSVLPAGYTGVILKNANGTVPDDKKFYDFSITYCTDPVVDAALAGLDLTVRFRSPGLGGALISNIIVSKTRIKV